MRSFIAALTTGRGRSGWLFAAIGAVLALARPARARDYEVQIRIESLEDLYELQNNGDLEEETVDILGALLQRPMDLNRADRYLLYDLPQVTYELADAIVARRAEKGAFASLEELADVPGMTPAILQAITPFLVITEAEKTEEAASPLVRGKAELGSIWRRGFDKDEALIDPITERESAAPQSYLRLTTTGLSYLGAGALATYRRRMDAYWDYSRGALVSGGPSDEVDLDHVYLTGGSGLFSLVLGSYAVGFGERLVFWGGAIDAQHVLASAPSERVYEEVRKNLAIWKPGGGYVFNNVHNIQAGVPPENIVAMFDAAYECGFYE